jgi:hypothetical protein
MAAPPAIATQEQIDSVVAQYLRKKGYTKAEQIFREEARLQSLESLAANSNLLSDLNVANYVMFYNPAEQHPRIYHDSYRELRKWVDQSLDMFQVRPRSLSLPLHEINNPYFRSSLS